MTSDNLIIYSSKRNAPIMKDVGKKEKENKKITLIEV